MSRLFTKFAQASALGWGIVSLASGALAAGVVQPGTVKIYDLELKTPDGWHVVQEGISEDGVFAVFVNGLEHFALYMRRQEGLNPKGLFGAGAQWIKEPHGERIAGRDWTLVQTRKSSAGKTAEVVGFVGAGKGVAYFGYGSGNDGGRSDAIVRQFLSSVD